MSVTEEKIIRRMKSIGTYKAEYKQTISICAGMMDQYEVLMDDYNRLLPCLYQLEKKPAIVATVETLRRDILSYMKELGLTPSALKKIDADQGMPESSPLADALRKFG